MSCLTKHPPMKPAPPVTNIVGIMASSSLSQRQTSSLHSPAGNRPCLRPSWRCLSPFSRSEKGSLCSQDTPLFHDTACLIRTAPGEEISGQEQVLVESCIV